MPVDRNYELEVLTKAYSNAAVHLAQRAGRGLPFPPISTRGLSPEVWFRDLVGQQDLQTGDTYNVPVCVYVLTSDYESLEVTEEVFKWSNPRLTNRNNVVLYKKVYEDYNLFAASDDMCIWVRHLRDVTKCEVLVATRMPLPNIKLENEPSKKAKNLLAEKYRGKAILGVVVPASGPLDLSAFVKETTPTNQNNQEEKTMNPQSRSYARKLSDVEVKGRKAQGDGKYSASDPAQLERMLSNQGVTPEMVQNLSDTVIGMMDQLIQEVQLTGRADPHFWNAEARQRVVQSLSYSLNIPA